MKKRVSPTKGMKIKDKDRGKDAPKLGRPFSIAEETESFNINLTLPKGVMKKIMAKYKTNGKSTAVRKAVLKSLD